MSVVSNVKKVILKKKLVKFKNQLILLQKNSFDIVLIEFYNCAVSFFNSRIA